MRLISTGGGTGGHVYPAISILAALRGRMEERGAGELEVLYVGSSGGLEEGIVRRAGLAFRAVAAGAVLGRSPLAVAGNLGRTLLGAAQAFGIIAGYRPRVVLATGGYVCVPVVFAAWLLRVPSLIYLPDMTPGLAVRTLARIASRIAVSFEEAGRYLPAGKTVATGYPVRPELFAVERVAARRALGLDADLPVVLVLGGSRGARAINDAVQASLPDLLPVAQVVHVAGEGEEPRLREMTNAIPADLAGRYRLYAYLHEDLAQALGAADVVVSRAGASVMGEYPAVGVPSILIPYPHAGAHQRLNAAQLATKGAAIVIDEGQLPSGILARTVGELLADKGRLESMRAAALRLARPQAGAAIADLLLQLAYRTGPVRAEG
jgi:UDP-N-acetylglucosamine--N-acetylmuramyl-(pentapeptide) pyrophosphoryl-undecaprenol N-acetylglucosamine transferase